MKRLLTILLITMSIDGLTQDIFGKWYMINRSGLIEFEITKDSLLTRGLFSDLRPKGRDGEAKPYKSIVTFDNKILVIAKDRRDTTKFSAMTIFEIKKNESFKMAWNVKDTATSDIESLIEIHKANKGELIGYSIYSEKYLATLNQMKDIDEMTLADFKKYAKIYVDKIQLTNSEFQKVNIGYAAVTYNFQLITQALFDSGFNPIENSSTVEAVYKKYYNDPEVKEIMEKGNQKK